MKLSSLILCSTLAWTVSAHPGVEQNGEPCPFLEQGKESILLEPLNKKQVSRGPTSRSLQWEPLQGDGGVPDGGYEAVMEDLRVLLTDSQPEWPGDFNGTAFGPHYGGLFIRLAWHCSGTYRQTDGRGGCDGGRIRHEPEISWMDNGNLDSALSLLQKIKSKYGSSLSWGDLIILSGTVAIQEMGGPILGFCGGRVDVSEGDFLLGPSEAQEEIGPCRSVGMDGDCLSVEGTVLVNPAGPMGAVRDLEASGMDIRRAFSRMGFNDTESVSLIGGGHAFGKAHGDPNGTLPLGGVMTSGFEGAWTTTPTKWSNEFFRNLFELDFLESESPAGEPQWAPADGTDIFMLTTDLALGADPEYRVISELYRDNITILEKDFAASWYRLTTQDMGPTQDRCLGNMVPPAQYWEFALPDAPSTLPDYIPIRGEIQSLIDDNVTTTDMLINLAYRCASTFRSTDFRGGCNGARIRFPPESDWPENTGIADVLAKLAPVKEKYPDASTADLIVLAGLTALESETEGLMLPFCGGYVDADNADGSEPLAPRMYDSPIVTIRDDYLVKGLTVEEGVALEARESLSSQFFMDLKAEGSSPLLEAEFGPVVDKFVSDEESLKKSFKSGWTKLMTGGRFKNNRENACTGVSTKTVEAPDDTSGASIFSLAVSVVGTVVVLLL